MWSRLRPRLPRQTLGDGFHGVGVKTHPRLLCRAEFDGAVYETAGDPKVNAAFGNAELRGYLSFCEKHSSTFQ